MKSLARLLTVITVLSAAAAPARAQEKNDQAFRWYWGGEGGAFGYKTNLQGLYFDPVLGGHWLITARRTALYVSYEQAFFLTAARASIPNVTPGNPDDTVTFSDMRRLMIGLVAFPAPKAIEPFFGGGFALMEVLNPTVSCPSCSSSADLANADQAAADASSKAFFWFMAGLQINMGKLALFGHYVGTSAAKGFLLDGSTHSIQGGIRYTFGTAKEGISEDH